MSRKVLVFLLPAMVWLTLPLLAQQSSSSQVKETPGSASAPYVMKSFSRMVTLDVVVVDHKGHHITGLKAGDFQIFEQTPSRSKKKHVQKIAELSEVHTAALKPPVKLATATTPGVYSNVIHVQKDPVPPTVLVVDGINTQVRYQTQMHEQMLKMLRQLPPNIPVAIVLMGSRLRILQSFTTDHSLLLHALSKAESTSGQQLGHLNPKDNPDASGNQMYGINEQLTVGGIVHGLLITQMIAAAKEFDHLTYAGNMAERFHRTYDAFLSIARSLQGYPGRKNVLWLSTSFPLTLNPFMQDSDIFIKDSDLGQENYWKQMHVLDNALSDANIAVYPVDIGGVRVLQAYTAEARPADPYVTTDTPEDGKRAYAAASRQMQMRNVEQDTMHAIAKDTGGKVCAGNNNLWKCVAKAVKDSSDFYEISYYPNSGDWNGEYRRIFVKLKEHGARLSYRHGYYATSEASPDPIAQAHEMQKDCGDLLNATGIAFTAKVMPPDEKGRPVLRLAIDPANLTFIPTPNGEQRINVEVGVCTFNRRGWKQRLMAYPMKASLNEKTYNSLMAGGHVVDSIYVPGEKPSAVRLIVKDVPSGKMGSVYIRSVKEEVSKR